MFVFVWGGFFFFLVLSMENGFVFVMVGIDLISVWGVELDKISV